MTMPEMQAVIYDQFGNPLVDVEIEAPRSWLLNDVGQCVFTMSSKNPKCTEKNLRFGNLLYIQSAGLADWVGIIDPPRGRNYGSITVTAYTAEYFYKIRTMQNPLEITSATPGNFFLRLLANANAPGGTQLARGSIYTGGPVVKDNFDLVPVFQELQTLANTYGNNFDVTAELSKNNTLVLYGNYYQRLGINRTDFLISDDNSELIDVNGVEEQGPFYNIVQGYGNAATWASRVRVSVSNASSISLYGPHQAAIRVDNNTNAVIKNKATSYLSDYLTASKILMLSVTNKNNLWSQINLGDIVPIKYSYGAFYGGENNIDMQARITGMAVDELAGKMQLTVQEV
jgi:hypothetical protein